MAPDAVTEVMVTNNEGPAAPMPVLLIKTVLLTLYPFPNPSPDMNSPIVSVIGLGCSNVPCRTLSELTNQATRVPMKVPVCL